MANLSGGSVIWNLDVNAGKLDAGLNSAKSSVEGATKGIDKSLNKAKKATTRTFEDVGRGVSNFGIGLTKAISVPVGLLAGTGLSFAKLGGQYASVQDAFRSMTADMGIDAKEFQKRVADATGGQIDNLTILQAATRGLSLIGKDAFNDFGNDFTRMAELSKKAARATGQDTDFLFESLVLGISRESKLILDNLGISLDITKAKEDYAKALGVEADALTASQEKNAVLNAALLQLEDTYGEVAVSAGGFSGEFQKLTTALQNTRIEIGVALEPVFTRLAGVMGEIARDIAPKMVDLTRRLAVEFSKINPDLVKTVAQFVLLASALGPVIAGIGFIIANAAFLILVGTLTAIVLLFKELISKGREFFGLLADLYKYILPKVQKKFDDFKRTLEDIAQDITDFRVRVGDEIERIVKIFSRVFDGIKKDVKKRTEEIKESFKNFVDTWIGDLNRWDTNTLSAVEIMMAKIVDAIWGELFQIGDDLSRVLDTWATDISLWGDATLRSFSEWGVSARDGIYQWAYDTNEAIKNWYETTRDSIFQWAYDTNAAVKEWVDSFPAELDRWILNTASKVIEWGDKFLDNLSIGLGKAVEALKEWWKRLGTRKEPEDAGKDTVKNVVKGIEVETRKIDTLLRIGKLFVLAIAGGIALVAVSIVLIGFDIIKFIIKGMYNAFKFAMTETQKIVKDIANAFLQINWGEVGRSIIDGIVGGLNRFGGNIASSIKSSVSNIKIPGFADGVTNFKGGLALVGERGPELVNLPRGADVISNADIGGSGRNVTINNTITMSRESDIDAFSRRLSFEAQTI